MADEDRVKLRFNGPWPKWRIIRRAYVELEKECRARDLYDLAHVTQQGDEYTLFFRLKETTPTASGEPDLKEATHAAP